jgi:hypothetical protein
MRFAKRLDPQWEKQRSTEHKMPNRGMPTSTPTTRMDGLICAARFAAKIPLKLLLYRYLEQSVSTRICSS